MKILFVSGYYPPVVRGGGELSTHLIAQALQQRGHEVHVIADGQRSEISETNGVHIQRLPLGLTAKPLLEKRMSRKIAHALTPYLAGYDIIHAHDFRSALALSETYLPNMVVTARDYAQICGTTNNILVDGATCHCTWADMLKTPRVIEASLMRKPFRVWQYKYNINYRRRAFQKFPYEIFISHAEQAEIAQQQNISHVHTAVIYNPVAPDYLAAPIATDRAGEVLFVGTVEWYKGVGILLEAWQRVVKQASFMPHLKIVGVGADLERYKAFTAQHNLEHSVTFAGRVPPERLRHLYDEASVVVAPHIWTEPFGRTVVEAMARGKIVVAANSGGPAELIQDTHTGLLFTPGNVDALTQQLQHALTLPELPRRAMQDAARRWVQDKLTPDKIAQQHEDFYTKVIHSDI